MDQSNTQDRTERQIGDHRGRQIDGTDNTHSDTPFRTVTGRYLVDGRHFVVTLGIVQRRLRVTFLFVARHTNTPTRITRRLFFPLRQELIDRVIIVCCCCRWNRRIRNSPGFGRFRQGRPPRTGQCTPSLDCRVMRLGDFIFGLLLLMLLLLLLILMGRSHVMCQSFSFGSTLFG